MAEDIDLGNGMMLRQLPEGSYTYPKELPTEPSVSELGPNGRPRVNIFASPPPEGTLPVERDGSLKYDPMVLNDPSGTYASDLKEYQTNLDKPISPVTNFFSGPANPERPSYLMEPDLLEAQQGMHLPIGIVQDAGGALVYKDNYDFVPMVKRYATLPLAKTPEGYKLAMPKMLDVLSNIMGGIGAPAVATKAGKVLLGSGAVKKGIKLTPVEGNPFAMDEASRMARANEQGFDTSQTYYHGTANDFSEFNPVTKPNGESGVFLSKDPAIASAYSKYDPLWSPEANGARVMPVYIKNGNYKTVDFKGSKYGRGEAIKEAKDAGYDGVILKNHYDAGGVQDQIVVFDPKNIRSKFAQFDPAKSDSGNLLYSDTRNQVVGKIGHDLEKGPFYSALERAVGDANLNKASADQWLGYLKNQPGVKSEEINTVLKDLPQGQITKEQLQGIVKDNGVKLGEVVKGEFNNSDLDAAAIRARETGNWAEYDRLLNQAKSNETSNTKYHQYQLPGGENYKEMLMTLPEKEPPNFPDFETYFKTRYKEMSDPSNPAYKMAEKEARKGWVASEGKIPQYEGAGNFTSSHWDEPNVIAHVRHNDRNLPVPFTDTEKAALAQHEAAAPKLEEIKKQQHWVALDIRDESKHFEAARVAKIWADNEAGKLTAVEAMRKIETHEPSAQLKPLQDKLEALRKQEDDLKKSLPTKPEAKTSKTLHLEEWQSDLHQQGRDRGYVGEKEKLQPEFDKIEKKLMDTNDEKLLGQPTVKGVLKDAVEKKIITQDEANTYKRFTDIENQTPVPDLPFKKNWEELALKKALHKAATEGYEGLSWTPGEAQALRYQNDIRTKLSSVDWHNKSMGKVDPEGNKQILVTAAHGSEIELTVDKHGEIIKGRPGLKGKNLDSVLGKDIARQVLEKSEGNVDAKNYVMNSEGMKAAYDKRAVDILNNIAKKYGSKVEQREISPYDKDNPIFKNQDMSKYDQPIHYLPITDALRAKAKEGFPLFSQVPVTVPVDFDPWQRKYNHDAHMDWRNK